MTNESFQSWLAGLDRRQLARKARRRCGRARQRGLSKQQVPVLLATVRGGATAGQVLERVS